MYDRVMWNGDGNTIISLFEDMKKKGFAPDETTILAVLQGCCCYSGLWETGLCLINEMETKYGIRPVIEHYSSMIDLLGRAGNLSKAVNIIDKSPFPESPLLWRTFVNAYKLCGDLQFGMWVFNKLLDLAPYEASSYMYRICMLKVICKKKLQR